MIIPVADVSNALTAFEQPITIKNVEKVPSINFVPQPPIITTRDIQAVVQSPKAEQLKVVDVDWSKGYKWVHSKKEMYMNEFVVYNGVDYKIIHKDPFNDYGYISVIAEEVLV